MALTRGRASGRRVQRRVGRRASTTEPSKRTIVSLLRQFPDAVDGREERRRIAREHQEVDQHFDIVAIKG
jgi:hypothetical protein